MANYIKTMQAEVGEMTAKLEQLETEKRDLIGYLSSPKFNCGNELDGYVSCGDVISRLWLMGK